jgi:N-acetylmuramoyl-L-alanine amidase
MHNIYRILFFLAFIIIIIANLVPISINNSFNDTSSTEYKTILIDAGHGGIDTGASYKSIYEKDINLSILKVLKKQLLLNNFNVIATRESDISLDTFNKVSSSRHKRDLFQRISIINDGNCEFFISLHVNSRQTSSASGPITFYNPSSIDSKLIASCIQESLSAICYNGYSPQKHKELPANFYVLKNSKKPGILLETGFITNTNDRILLVDQDYQAYLASKILDGINSYYIYREQCKSNLSLSY